MIAGVAMIIVGIIFFVIGARQYQRLMYAHVMIMDDSDYKGQEPSPINWCKAMGFFLAIGGIGVLVTN